MNECASRYRIDCIRTRSAACVHGFVDLVAATSHTCHNPASTGKPKTCAKRFAAAYRYSIESASSGVKTTGFGRRFVPVQNSLPVRSKASPAEQSVKTRLALNDYVPRQPYLGSGISNVQTTVCTDRIMCYMDLATVQYG